MPSEGADISQGPELEELFLALKDKVRISRLLDHKPTDGDISLFIIFAGVNPKMVQFASIGDMNSVAVCAGFQQELYGILFAVLALRVEPVDFKDAAHIALHLQFHHGPIEEQKIIRCPKKAEKNEDIESMPRFFGKLRDCGTLGFLFKTIERSRRTYTHGNTPLNQVERTKGRSKRE
jgi:hypothetical protein